MRAPTPRAVLAYGDVLPAPEVERFEPARICYDLSGVKRLIEFRSIAGTRLHLVTYTRKKE